MIIIIITVIIIILYTSIYLFVLELLFRCYIFVSLCTFCLCMYIHAHFVIAH
jgi:hypothetical protein